MTNPLFDMTGKVALITGSTKGIGRAIAEEMARLGAKVVISSRKAEACEQVASELKAQGYEAIAIPCHVGKKDQLQNLVDKTNEAWGTIDVLVCNAATNPVYGTTAEMTDDAWDKIMDTNVKGTFWLTNMVLPQMAEKGEGAVVLLSSIAGIRGNTTIGTYGVSKAAEAALARNLAVEWGPKGIRINSIAPGLIKTDFARALWEDPVRVKRAEDKTPLRRIGDPVDIAGLAVFLSTRASAYITGQVIHLFAGHRQRPIRAAQKAAWQNPALRSHGGTGVQSHACPVRANQRPGAKHPGPVRRQQCHRHPVLRHGLP